MTNDDERMDRAKRIREMREGSREGDSEDETEEADGGESAETGEPSEEVEPEADEDAEQPEPSEDESAEKQTMEDLVESAAEGADDDATEELDLDEELTVDEELDEIDTTESEEAVVEEVEAAVSDDNQSTTNASEPDNDPAMTATEDLPEEATIEDEPETASEDEDDDVAAPLPDTETLENALGGTEESDAETVTPDEGDMPAAPGTESEEAEAQEEETRVLEFRLDDEYYCLDIEYIEEIVKEETITRVPNTPKFVEGVVDLRGQITTILNPKVTLGKEDTDADQLIVVFDSEAFEDQGHIGWVVDDVRQVSPITDSEVNDPPVEDDHINGVIDREDDDQFVIWTSPALALEEAGS